MGSSHLVGETSVRRRLRDGCVGTGVGGLEGTDGMAVGCGGRTAAVAEGE